MPHQRDPIIHRVTDRVRAAPWNMLITPKAAQPTRRGRPPQAVYHVDVMSVMNEDHDASIVDLGFMVGSLITWTRTFACTTAGYWYRNNVHYTLTSDYQLLARFRLVTEGDGAYVGDIVHLNVNGYYLEPYTSQ